MNDLQAKQIIELRLKGIGYKLIASKTGLTRDIVRNYCKTHGINGFGEAAKLNLQENIKQGNACMLCGIVIKQPIRGRRKKFCSDACRRQWWKNHQDEIDRKDTALYNITCAKCGKEFESYGNKNRKYCSHNCYLKDRFYKEENNGV